MSFKTEKGWPAPGFSLDPRPTLLPPRPRIKPVMLDVCSRCGVMHTNRQELIDCLSAPREQR